MHWLGKIRDLAGPDGAYRVEELRPEDCRRVK